MQRYVPDLESSHVASSAVESDQSKAKRKRNVLLDADSERLLLQQEREEFKRVLQEQFEHIDVNKLGTLPECQNVEGMHLECDNSWEYWMSVMVQYQALRSYPHYTPDEEQQQKQLEWQKEMRFQLMQKKRAIKREKRKILKLQKQLDPKKKSSKRNANKRTREKEDLEDKVESQNTKRIKLGDENLRIQTSNLSVTTTSRSTDSDNDDSSSNDFALVTPFDFLLPSPFPMTSPALTSIQQHLFA